MDCVVTLLSLMSLMFLLVLSSLTARLLITQTAASHPEPASAPGLWSFSGLVTHSPQFIGEQQAACESSKSKSSIGPNSADSIQINTADLIMKMFTTIESRRCSEETPGRGTLSDCGMFGGGGGGTLREV